MEAPASDSMQKTFGLLFAADRLMLMDKIERLENENTVVITDGEPELLTLAY